MTESLIVGKGTSNSNEGLGATAAVHK